MQADKVTSIHTGEKHMSAEKAKFTVFDVQTIVQILNMRTPQSVGIRDLRALDATVNLLKKALPPAPAQPTIRQVKEGDAPHTDEEKKAFQQGIADYNKAMEEYTDLEIEVEMVPAHLGLVKSRLASFSGYFSDDEARKKTLALADRLGI